MDETTYKQLLAQLECMTYARVEELLGRLQARHDTDGTQRLILAYLAERHCPHCRGEKVVKNGYNWGMRRFLCRGCRKTFAATTGAPFHPFARPRNAWS